MSYHSSFLEYSATFNTVVSNVKPIIIVGLGEE